MVYPVALSTSDSRLDGILILRSSHTFDHDEVPLSAMAETHTVVYNTFSESSNLSPGLVDAGSNAC